jgi:hypothetical protein
MRKASLKQNHVAFDDALIRYRAFLTKILAAQRVIASVAEKRDLAESVLLRLCANWEAFLDEHLVDCVNCDHAKLNDYFSLTLPSNPSKALCEALVIGDRYRDFKDMGALKGFSKRILPDAANPFLAISQTNLDRIDEVYRIRNYLAHYSSAATKSLMALYKTKYNMNKFLEPGQFLLAYDARRLWTYFDAFDSASAQMKATY